MATILLVTFWCLFFGHTEKARDGYNLTGGILVTFVWATRKQPVMATILLVTFWCLFLATGKKPAMATILQV